MPAVSAAAATRCALGARSSVNCCCARSTAPTASALQWPPADSRAASRSSRARTPAGNGPIRSTWRAGASFSSACGSFHPNDSSDPHEPPLPPFRTGDIPLSRWPRSLARRVVRTQTRRKGGRRRGQRRRQINAAVAHRRTAASDFGASRRGRCTSDAAHAAYHPPDGRLSVPTARRPTLHADGRRRHRIRPCEHGARRCRNRTAGSQRIGSSRRTGTARPFARTSLGRTKEKGCHSHHTGNGTLYFSDGRTDRRPRSASPTTTDRTDPYIRPYDAYRNARPGIGARIMPPYAAAARWPIGSRLPDERCYCDTAIPL